MLSAVVRQRLKREAVLKPLGNGSASGGGASGAHEEAGGNDWRRRLAVQHPVFVYAGLKALGDFRLKAGLRPGCGRRRARGGVPT